MKKTRIKTRIATQAPSATNEESLRQQLDRMHADNYRVFPATMFNGDAETLGQMSDVVNFASLSLTGKAVCSDGVTHRNAQIIPGGFTSSGSEVKEDHCGTPGRGWISWGANNRLPNYISLANSTLVYTATGLKFNVDTACGTGLQFMYKYYTNAGGATEEEQIPFASAGNMIKERIRDLQSKIFAVTKDYVNQPPRENENGNAEDRSVIRQMYDILKHDGDDEKEDAGNDEVRKMTRDADGSYFKRIADDILECMVEEYLAEIALLQKQYGVWRRTNKAVKAFRKQTNLSLFNLEAFNDLVPFQICFPEIQLSQEGTQRDTHQWKPKIVALSMHDAQTCRLERHDETGVSQFVYLSNQWLDARNSQTDVSEDKDKHKQLIDALPALDPHHPLADLQRKVRKFRLNSETDGADIAMRPCRFILPVSYPTSGRPYYPQPPFWAIYNDIFQYAGTIIRDRAIRKQNENMFGRIVYVHSEYLDRLVNQVNAAKTDEEKAAIKAQEVAKIKNFLANKFNNGQTFSACTFIGSDGKDHDAFRVETIPYNTKSAAEADKTEISDISSIIMFALECHPDLIGSTPGGSSSKGGTYQREMLQIKQAKMAATQNLILAVYEFVRDFNEWDSHLCFKFGQKTLTTLDRNHRGEIDE